MEDYFLLTKRFRDLFYFYFLKQMKHNFIAHGIEIYFEMVQFGPLVPSNLRGASWFLSIGKQCEIIQAKCDKHASVTWVRASPWIHNQ